MPPFLRLYEPETALRIDPCLDIAQLVFGPPHLVEFAPAG
jgi:hypothetical protein